MKHNIYNHVGKEQEIAKHQNELIVKEKWFDAQLKKRERM